MAKFCYQCGASLPDDASFCGECGASQGSAPQPAAAGRPTVSAGGGAPKGVVALAIAAVVVVALIAGGIWGWNAYQENRRLAEEKATEQKLATVKDFVTALAGQDPQLLLDVSEKPDELEAKYPDFFKEEAEGGSSDITWSESGASLSFTVEDQDGSYLVRVSSADPKKVTISPRDGAEKLPNGFESIDMVPVKDGWKISNKWLMDAMGPQLGDSSSGSSSGSSTSSSGDSSQSRCYANQRTIEGAAQVYQADKGTLPSSGIVSDGGDLVPTFIKSAPSCPTTGRSYILQSDGTVESCSAHGHF